MKTIKMFMIMYFFTGVLIAQNEFKVQVSGSGDPVLLFPGFACTGEVFQDVTTQLEKEFEVHSFTFAGFGGTDGIGKSWFPQIKEAVFNYVKINKLESSIAIGHSMGGTLSLWLASESPEMFKKLIIVDALPAMGALMIPNFKSENISYDSPYNDRILQMSEAEFEKMAQQMATSMTQNSNFQKKIAEWMVMTDRETYVYGYTDLLKLDLRNDLKAIKIPVTILGATYPFGKEIAEKNYREQYAALKGYTLIFAEGSGHFIMYDKPEWFVEQINLEINVQ